MVNLKELTSIQSQTARLSEQRHQRSQKQCQQGFSFLFQAEQEDFAHKNLLIQACDAFGEAIAQQRHSPDAYFGMAYVLFLLKDYPQALHYLVEAAQIDPEHSDTQTLLAKIKRLTQSPQGQGTHADHGLPFLSPEAEMDYDQLYDEVEALILEEVRALVSSQTRPPVASLKAQEQAALQASMERQSYVLKQIRAQLEIVEQEIDTAELRFKLKTIERMRKRYQQALNISAEMQRLQTGLTDLEARLPPLSKQIEAAPNRSELTALEGVLESITDRCDQFADCLDEMEQVNQPIHPLLEQYEEVVSKIENLNDLYDDALDQW